MKKHQEQINLGYIHDVEKPPPAYRDSVSGDRVQLQRNLGLCSGISIIVGRDTCTCTRGHLCDVTTSAMQEL